ncbi:uridine kinase family protein [Ekhidna sp. To15]|uniref:uridine kinase family protein n=1 Tax=Ekhidna sp. To15 TaxID=3395267 RepID=UPI003F51BD9B
MPQIIGIGGCSRSGKSSLACRIKEQLSSKQVLLLDMDDYVFPASQIPKIQDRTDWERPESVDYYRLCQAIEENGSAYDVIVVEGILVFANQQLLSLFDTTVWIQVSKETFLDRRRKETRWGDEPDWFLEHVWKSHLQYGQFLEADFIISGEAEVPDLTFKELISSLN